MNLERRVARLEASAGGLRDSTGGVLLSPYDAAILIIERTELDGSSKRGNRIDALLESHSRAVAYTRSEPMTPEEAGVAMIRAAERDEEPDAAEKYRRERLAELLQEECE